MNDYILIEYSNSVDFGDILYQNTFENKIYLDADVSKPEYEIVEEGVENGDGEFLPTFQKWAKKYSITFYAQEFLVDALTLMTLHDQITVTLRNGEASNVLDAEVEYKWDSNIECWAEVTLSFVTDYIIRKKCDENQDLSCLAAICTADDVYDADDAGAGQDKWDGTTPSVNGSISFFYVSSFGCGEYADSSGASIGFYELVDSVWTLVDMDVGQVSTVTGLATPNWLIKVSEFKYERVPYLCTVTDQTGGVAQLKVLAEGIENTFFQVQKDIGAGYVDVGTPLSASLFDLGYDITVGAGVAINFRIEWYTHNCAYGYSNVVAQTIT